MEAPEHQASKRIRNKEDEHSEANAKNYGRALMILNSNIKTEENAALRPFTTKETFFDLTYDLEEREKASKYFEKNPPTLAQQTKDTFVRVESKLRSFEEALRADRKVLSHTWENNKCLHEANVMPDLEDLSESMLQMEKAVEVATKAVGNVIERLSG